MRLVKTNALAVIHQEIIFILPWGLSHSENDVIKNRFDSLGNSTAFTHYPFQQWGCRHTDEQVTSKSRLNPGLLTFGHLYFSMKAWNHRLTVHSVPSGRLSIIHPKREWFSVEELRHHSVHRDESPQNVPSTLLHPHRPPISSWWVFKDECSQ